ncbi:MAG: AAA family ATPase [Phycisphaerae bacterium]
MYRDHFGLTADPFNNTPDPRFFFNTPNHEEALASLLYTATMRKGFALVTGEVGSGKTLLTRLAIGRLPVGTQTAVITNTRLTGPELLVAVCREFQLRADHTSSPAELTHTLEQFLLEQYARDRLCVVILDEAQNLSPDAFEELRLLGNLEAEDAKLLQILILGQPELQETFRRSDLRQLRQRMFRVFHLGGLSEEQTLGYIRHRIDVAGGQADALFDAPAITAIHRASRGLPRIINQLADNCLLHAYSSGATRITAQTVQACIDVVEIDAPLTAAAEPAATPPTAATPRRAAAPTVDGRAARHSARTAAVATTDIIAAETERAGTAIAATVSAESLAAVDAVVERLGERLSNFERRIDTIALQLKTPRETAEQVESDLARIRNARHQAQEMLEDARGRLDAMTARFGEVTLQGEADLRMLADRTGQTLRHAEDQTQEVARRADRLRSEVLAQRDAQLKQIVAADATAALDAGELRRQIETATADMRRVTEATNDRLDEMWKLLGTDLATTRSELAELRKRSDARAAAALDAERIAAEAKARVEETIRQAEQRVEQLRQQIEALPRAESAAHAASLAAAQAARARVAELVASAEGLCATAQAQINDTVNDLHRTVATQVAAAQREAQQPLDESRRALGDFESAVAAARAEAQRVRSELDAAVERARATVAQTTQQFAATLDGHRADVADLQRAATTVHGELSHAATSRARGAGRSSRRSRPPLPR